MYTMPDSKSYKIRRLPAETPLVILKWKNGYGQLKEGEWVKQTDIIRRLQTNLVSQYRSSITQESNTRGRIKTTETTNVPSRTITPFTRNQYQKSSWKKAKGSPRTVIMEDELPQSLLRFRENKNEVHSRSGLPSTFKMIQDGKSLAVKVDTGQLRSTTLSCIMISVDDEMQTYDDELFDKVGEL
eukprot:UN32935